MRMHADQLDVSVEVVARLVAEQFPRWRALPVRPVRSDGTVNALFRLGDDVVLRFPLRPADAGELAAEQDLARRVAPHLPVPVPAPLGLGEPGPGYPGSWAAYRWIAGEPARSESFGDRQARDLAAFVRAWHAMDTGGRRWDGRGRGGPLAGQDDWVRHSLSLSADLIDTRRLAGIWARCRAAAAAEPPAVWIHADLMPGNLLVQDGRLAGVIDLGAATIGDPAVDLMPAWNLLRPGPREAYRRALGMDAATWERGRGWTIVQGIGALPYYRHTNPGMAETARRTLQAVLDDEANR